MLTSKESYPISYVCIIPKCNQQSRIIETENEKKCHQHNRPNSNHIITQQEFKPYIKQLSLQQQTQEQQQLETYIQKLNQIQDIIQKLIQQLQLQYNKEIYEYKIKIKELLEEQDKNKQSLLINELLHFSIHYDNKNNRDPLQQIVKMCEEFRNFSKFFQGVEYHDHILQENKINNIVACQISNDDKYLLIAYSKEVQINHLENKKCQKLLIKLIINCSKLSDDSLYLYCGTDLGHIYCFSIKKLKLIYKVKVDQKNIHFIKPINENQLLIHQKYIATISFLDLMSKQQLKIIKDESLTQYIYSLDFDQLEKVIIAGYSNSAIKVISRNGKLILIQQKAHVSSIYSIQVLNNGNFISNSGNDLKIWRADYNWRTLTIIKQFSVNRFIHAISSLLDNQIIIIIHQQVIEIFDKDFNLILSINQDINPNSVVHQNNQSDHLNYILIQGQRCIKVMKKQLK